jgi:hypothetical protein
MRKRLCVGAFSPRRAAILTAVLALSLLAPSTAGAASVRSEFYGIVQTPWTLDTKDLQGLRANKVRTVRFSFDWRSVQPKRPNGFNWVKWDTQVGRLAAYGIRVVPAMWGNPKWVGQARDWARPPIDSAKDKAAWQNFLKAAVRRYGPGGIYWNTGYKEQYGEAAVPLPITTWQVWNEPNLKKFFIHYPSPKEYAQLLALSHGAIKSVDSNAQILLGGMPGNGDVKATDFLNELYKQAKVPNVKRYFNAAALHPYNAKLSQVESQISQFRGIMKRWGDAAKPLWISEIAWGSARPDSKGINKGPAGQAQMLKDVYKLILSRRSAWRIERLFWYHWRDPKVLKASCTFCGTAGLLNFKRTPKPAFKAFKGFAAETVPPIATITSGPGEGSTVQNPKPSFSFKSSEAGSTFECRFDAKPLAPCTAPTTPKGALTSGAHSFSVRAIDAAGNLSATVTRSFTVAP